MIMIGYIFLFLTSMFPVLRLVYMDWISSFFFIIPLILCIYRMWVADTMLQTDRIPRWKQLVNYVRRDNKIIPLVGERAFPGESFLDIPNLGLMEFLGKDCVYSWGDKKVVWGLENINFSPDPRYGNFTHTLWRLGFSDSDEVKQVLAGHLPELRDKVYSNIMSWVKPVDKLTYSIKSYEGPVVDFSSSKDVDHDKAAKFLDNWSK